MLSIDIANELLSAAKDEKTARVARPLNGSTDLETIVEAYRGHEPIARLTMNPDRDLMLRLAQWCAVGLSADVVALRSEGWTRVSDLNPVTGRDWEPGEMGQVATEHDGLAKGWVSEGLIISVHNRADDQLTIHQPYVIEGRTVSFGAPWSVTDADGYVTDVMAAAMREPTQLEQLAVTPELQDLPADRLLLASDMGAVTGLTRFAPAARVQFYAKPGTARHQELRSRFDRSDILVPHMPGSGTISQSAH